jgi:uncharacterized membrane protein
LKNERHNRNSNSRSDSATRKTRSFSAPSEQGLAGLQSFSEYEATTNLRMRKKGNLVVVGFDEPHKAEEFRLRLQKLQSEYLLDLADVVVAIKDETNEVKLHRAGHLTADDAVPGSGSLVSVIFLNAARAAASGALTLTDVGINDRFMKELAATLVPGGSALFVLTRTPSPDRDRMLEELKGLGGKILMTSLSHEDAATLQAALSTVKSAEL